jgi:YVTN family beta-propeller protein
VTDRSVSRTKGNRIVPRLALLRRQLLAASFLGLMAVLPGTGAAVAAPAVEQSRKIADGLYQIVVSDGQDRLYVASTGKRGENAARILALDPKTLDTVGTIDIADHPAFGLGLNDRTGTLYATATRDGAVLAIDLKSGQVVATISHGEDAHVREVLVEPESNKVYVSVFGGRDGGPGEIWVIDGATNELERVIENPGSGISGLAIDPARGELYAADMTSNEVVLIDLAEGAVAAKYPSGGDSPINLAIDPAGHRLFVANQKSGDVSVLDIENDRLVKTIPTGEGALGLAYNPGNELLYVGNRRAGTVSVIDTDRLEVIASLPTGTHPQTIAIDPETNVVYVTNKAKSAGRGKPPIDDPNGDTVSIITP